MAWTLTITSFVFNPAPTAGIDQVVEVGYREGGTSGPFIMLGNISVNNAGEITSVPNPFTLAGLPDDWDSVDIYIENDCSSKTKTFLKE